MEDVIAVHFENDDDTKEIVFAYFGIFDGHGGAEASNFTKEHLIDEIACQKGFWSHDDEQIKKAIRDGFLNTHNSMWKAIRKYMSKIIQCTRSVHSRIFQLNKEERCFWRRNITDLLKSLEVFLRIGVNLSIK